MHSGPPHIALYGYAYAKRAHAVQIDTYKKQYNVDFSYLIPTNMYGKSKHSDRMHFVNDLVVKIIRATRNHSDHITLFGDGTPLRQFISARDFARFISFYVDKGLAVNLNVSDRYNRSIDEMANIAVNLYNPKLKIKYDESRPNGQYRKDVDVSKLEQFFPEFKFTSLNKGLTELFTYYEKIL